MVFLKKSQQTLNLTQMNPFDRINIRFKLRIRFIMMGHRIDFKAF